MNFSYHDIKEVLYLFETLFGVITLSLSLLLFWLMGSTLEPIEFFVPGAICLIVGVGCIFFGVETYLLRDDPDVWR